MQVTLKLKSHTVELTDEELEHRATHATGERHCRLGLIDAQLGTVLELLLIISQVHSH